jgi:hypothetical protein
VPASAAASVDLRERSSINPLRVLGGTLKGLVLMQTLEKFLVGSDVWMSCRELPSNGGHEGAIAEPWAPRHYVCELRGSNGDRPVRRVIGSDDGPPDLVDVLDILAAEAAVVEDSGDFEGWAAQMGYSPDSRRAERTYRAELRNSKLLRGLLGEDGYRRLLWETMRL